MNWLAWCTNPARALELSAGVVVKHEARTCVVVAFDLAHGDAVPGLHLWVATLCGDRPRLGGPISFGPTPPTELPAKCTRCAKRLDELEERETMVAIEKIIVGSGDPDAFVRALEDIAKRGPKAPT